MLTSANRRRLVVASCLGLLLVLGIRDTSLAAGPHRVAARAINPERPAGAETAEVGREENLKLRLAWFDTVGLPDKVVQLMKRWVEETFGQIGLVIEWHETNSVSTGDEADDGYYLKVMLFGKEPATMGCPQNAMGIVIGTDFPPDAVWLFDPVIRRALQSSKRRSRPLSSEQLGRAYGRVLAHEVLHAIANDMRHADSGLMAPTHNRNLLISAGMEVDYESVVALVRGLERIRLATVVAGQ